MLFRSVVDHVPNEVGGLEDVQQRNELATNNLEYLRVVYVRVDHLAKSDLIFFSVAILQKTVAAEFKYVLRQLFWDAKT